MEYQYTPGSFSYTEAKDACAALGTGWTLPVPQSVEENIYVTTKIDGSIWLGISDENEEGVWRNIYTGIKGH